MNHGNFVTKRRTTVSVKESPTELAELPFPVKIPNQNWALISYVGPETIPKCGGFGVRIYGTFTSKEECDDVANKAFEQGYTYFDLLSVDISHGFFPLPPPPDLEIPDVKYQDENLNAIMSKHKEQLERGSNTVAQRADATGDDRIAGQSYESLVTKEAKQLFAEWKSKGKMDSHARMKKKIAKRYNSKLEAISQKTHGCTLSSEMSSKEAKIAKKQAAELMQIFADHKKRVKNEVVPHETEANLIQNPEIPSVPQAAPASLPL
jgi:hypothetical protein